MKVYAVALTRDQIVINGTPFARTSTISNFGHLLSGIHRLNPHSESTVLLNADVASDMGIGERVPRSEYERKNHPSLSLARDQLWHTSQLAPWMTWWHHDKPSVHVGLTRWFAPKNFASWQPDRLDLMTYTLSRFQELARVPFRITPGTTGMAMLREGMPWRTVPLWQPKNWDLIEPASYRTDSPYVWVSPIESSEPYRHSYDVNKQFLSAMINVRLGIDQLAYRKVTDFDEQPGFWRIIVPAWNHPYMPHPVGDRHKPGERIWTTSERVRLLLDLSNEGACAEPEIHECWTSARSGFLLKPFATTIRDGIAVAEHDSGESGPILDRLFRAVYKESFGMLGNPRSRVVRYDWHYLISAMAHSNQFRRLWKIGREEGRWPTSIDKDTVWYASDAPDPITAAPVHLPLFHAQRDPHRGIGLREPLGCWKVVGTRHLPSAVATS